MKQIAQGDIRGWLTLGFFLLAQTAVIVGAFVRLQADMDYSQKDREKIHTEIERNRTDNVAEHKEIMAKIEEHMRQR